MIEVHFRDDDCNSLFPDDHNDSVPENATTMILDDLIGGTSMDYKTLGSMLKKSSGKLSKAHLHDESDHDMTPEYLECLIAIFKRIETIELRSLGGDAAYSCLRSSLLRDDGPRQLHFCSVDFVSLHQARILFDGIALSTSLKSLELFFSSFEGLGEIESLLIEAMRRNSSLKLLEVDIDIFPTGAALQEFFNVAVLETKVENLTISRGEVPMNIPLEIVIDALLQEGCFLKKLKLNGITPSRRQTTDMNISNNDENTKNSSVTCFTVTESPLDCSNIMDIVCSFQCIEQLCIKGHHRVSDLSALDPLLIGDNATLKSLKLQHNNISQENAIVLLRKLPKMKYLENLDLSYNSFARHNTSDGSWENVAIDSIWQNKSLECFYYGDDEDTLQIRVPLSLNRGGRRALEIGESPPVLPASVWPRVLERAAKLEYCDYPQHEEKGIIVDLFGPRPKPVESTRVDVVYWFLREKMVGQCL